MSRVRKPGKFMNTNHYDNSVTGPSKMKRIHTDSEDYHKAGSLSSWLFMKYDMSYRSYRNRSKNRRIELRNEFETDTGISLAAKEQESHLRRLENPEHKEEYEDAICLLASIGVPFAPDGTPLGIGWDD